MPPKIPRRKRARACDGSPELQTALDVLLKPDKERSNWLRIASTGESQESKRTITPVQSSTRQNGFMALVPTHSLVTYVQCTRARPWVPSTGSFYVAHPDAVLENKEELPGGCWVVCPWCKTRFQVVAFKCK